MRTAFLMSTTVQGWVWNHSRARQSTLLIAIALAEHAHHDGSGAYPSIATLALKARCSERQVQRAIRDLVALGEITIDPNAGPRGVNVYTFTLTVTTPVSPRQNVTPTNRTARGDKSGINGVTPVSPKPSLEPSLNRPTPSGEGVSAYERSFDILREIPKWPRVREPVATEWLTRDKLTAEHAYEAAIAIKAQYNPAKHRDLVATLVKWARNERQWNAKRSLLKENTPDTEGWRDLVKMAQT